MRLNSLLETIGHTPLVRLKSSLPHVQVFGKLEMFNPSGSIKDRVALYVVEKAEAAGLIKPGGTLVECSSGNMGTSLAMVGALKGYSVIVTLPDKTGPMKRKMIETYGAQVVVCPGKVSSDHPDHYTQQAKRIAETLPNAYFVNQYANLWNTECHERTLGPEILDEMSEPIDYLIACGGSGGTVSGIARYLKSKDPKIKVWVPDPAGSIYYDLFHEGRVVPENIYPYQVEGPGNPVCCPTMDLKALDHMERFSDQEAHEYRSRLAIEQGIFGGDSSGAVYWLYQRLLKKLALSDPRSNVRVVLIFPDSGMKYLRGQ